jgi:hypothetical protein
MKTDTFSPNKAPNIPVRIFQTTIIGTDPISVGILRVDVYRNLYKKQTIVLTSDLCQLGIPEIVYSPTYWSVILSSVS